MKCLFNSGSCQIDDLRGQTNLLKLSIFSQVGDLKQCLRITQGICKNSSICNPSTWTENVTHIQLWRAQTKRSAILSPSCSAGNKNLPLTEICMFKMNFHLRLRDNAKKKKEKRRKTDQF